MGMIPNIKFTSGSKFISSSSVNLINVNKNKWCSKSLKVFFYNCHCSFVPIYDSKHKSFEIQLFSSRSFKTSNFNNFFNKGPLIADTVILRDHDFNFIDKSSLSTEL